MKISVKRPIMLAALLGTAAMVTLSSAVIARRNDKSVMGTITLNEGSGAVALDSSGNTVLLEGNENGTNSDFPDVQLIQGAAKAFANNAVDKSSTPLLVNQFALDDVEDVAWDPRRKSAFLLASHSKNKNNKIKSARYKLARILLSGNTITEQKSVDTLTEAMKSTFPSIVKPAIDVPESIGGPNGTLNIEGAVFVPQDGTLLLGLRSPTGPHGEAIVLRLLNPHELFDPSKPGMPQPTPKFDPNPILLKLRADNLAPSLFEGVRGMTYDPQRKGCWIVSGRSAHDKTSDPWKLWFWDLNATHAPVLKPVPADIALSTPEGICCMPIEGKPGLLLVEDNNTTTSHYALIYKPL